MKTSNISRIGWLKPLNRYEDGKEIFKDMWRRDMNILFGFVFLGPFCIRFVFCEVFECFTTEQK